MALTGASGPSVYGNHRRPIAVPHRPRRHFHAGPQSQARAQIPQAPPQFIQMHPQWVQLGLIPVLLPADSQSGQPPRIGYRPVNPFQNSSQPDSEPAGYFTPVAAWNSYKANVYHIADANKGKKKKKNKANTTIRKVIEKRPKIIEGAGKAREDPTKALQEAVERWEKGYVIDKDAALEKMKKLIEELEGRMVIDGSGTGLEPGEIAVDAAGGDSMDVDRPDPRVGQKGVYCCWPEWYGCRWGSSY